MSISQMFLPEFDQESANTRKTLERVPDDKWDWKPHAKSGTLGWLAGHVATLPDWIAVTINTDHLDFAPIDGPRYEAPKTRNRKELLEVFSKLSAKARAAIAGASDEHLMKPWTLLMGGQTLYHAARCRSSRVRFQSHHPSSRPAHNVLAFTGYSAPRSLRSQCRRAILASLFCTASGDDRGRFYYPWADAATTRSCVRLDFPLELL